MSDDRKRNAEMRRALDRAQREVAWERRHRTALRWIRTLPGALPLIFAFCSIIILALPLLLGFHALFASAPDMRELGDITAQYDGGTLRFWFAAAVCFLFVYLFLYAALIASSGSRSAFYVAIAVAAAAFGEGMAWLAGGGTPAIVIAKGGISCWPDSIRSVSLKWPDIADVRRGKAGAGARGYTNVVEFRLKPGIGSGWCQCPLDHVETASEPLYQQIRAAWERGR